MMETQIRKATKEDVPHIVQMLASDKLGAQREKYSDPLPEAYYGAFEKIDRDINQELVVIQSDAGVIGTLQLTCIPYLTYQGGLRAQIEQVRVREDMRGKGIGRALFRWAIRRAQERGAHLVQLTTDKRRPDALKFYKRLGFEATHDGMKLHF